jgi:hypothetical protein
MAATQSKSWKPCSRLLVVDMAYDDFAYTGDKVVERPVFFLARDEFAFQFDIVVPVQLPRRRLVYF